MPIPLWQEPHFALLNPSGSRKTSAVPEADPQTFNTLLAVAVGMVVLILFIGWRISRRLARIEQQLTDIVNRSDSETSPPTHAETRSGGAFETFLNGDSARRLLTKSEQFAAYRKWRQEKGLNWTGDPNPSETSGS